MEEIEIAITGQLPVKSMEDRSKNQLGMAGHLISFFQRRDRRIGGFSRRREGKKKKENAWRRRKRVQAVFSDVSSHVAGTF
jgi:hypothetical protein